MALNAYPNRSTEPETVSHQIRILGTGASNPTKQLGAGVTVTRTGAGAYLITWAENPGTFVGWSAGLGAATPGDLAGHTVIRDTYDSSAYTLAFVLYNASDAAHDLAADEYIDIEVRFRQGGVAGV